MNAKELLNSWLSDNDCKKLAEDINYIDDSSFSFSNVIIESIIYELKNNSYSILFKCGDVKRKLYIHNLVGRAMSYPLPERFDIDDSSYIVVKDLNDTLAFIFSNNSCGLFMIIYGREASLSYLEN